MANTANPEKKKRRNPIRWLKEAAGELKKVTWPTFGHTMKQLGIVLAVTLVFLLVLMGMDALFGFLYNQLLTGLNAETFSALTVYNSVSNIPILGALPIC